MARKRAATSPSTAGKTAAKRRVKRRTATKSAAPAAASARATPPPMPDLRELAKMSKMMTPEQAIDFYKTNAKMALDVINAAIDSAARLRKKQFEGEEEMRAFQQKHARAVGAASDAQSLMAASQGADAADKLVDAVCGFTDPTQGVLSKNGIIKMYRQILKRQTQG